MSQVSQPQQYRHPGQVFISRYGLPQNDESILHYVKFLRQEAKLSDSPPIDLSIIYRHFGMPTPLRAPLIDQQGILVDSDTGIILIKEDDPIVRQRFTEGHELMELLFDAQERLLTETQVKLNWNEQRKEQLCDQGAAELLLPKSSFLPQLQALGMSLQTGCTLAELYQTSLLATLVRMIQCCTDACALVMWHSALTRQEAKNLANSTDLPAEKLRVWWRSCTSNWSCGFIPKNKSIPPDSCIAQAYATGQFQEGIENVNLGKGALLCRIEAMPMQIGDKNCVISLLHWLKI
ncbi:protein of unknown function DUF955 [Crinalium epipsammum PCC 9333]|uniref:IrrE N-terminal-like domain-containing protein n=1 Tax=Crinalium epipsammum PCC 9333 TaxID=1173022 RepID=K9W574_9CYAN|nr:ImmA/IrrE family metallo-endopeptidase [Crinalium epipsammum]AFZ15351.1 protein of unknown function DUF955 [Crinalium epipsammum PCC 9333]